jgi:hypothetical protein
MDLQGVDIDPITYFDSELKTFLEQRMDAGELIILGIDANTDIRSGPFADMLQSIGLVNVLPTKFGNDIPPTYARGSLPIDGIFISSTLTQFKTGLLPICCDHRALWLEIPQVDAFGLAHQRLPIKVTKRLILQDPRVVAKYTTAVQQRLEAHQFLDRIQKIQSEFLAGNEETAIALYDEADAIRTAAILSADKNCRKLRMGNVPFSPMLLEHWQKILALRLLIRKLEGRNVNSKYLARQLKKSGIKRYHHLSLSEVKERLSTTVTNYRFEKRNALEYRETWIEGVASARAETGNLSAAQEMRNMLLREKQRSDARQIKYVISSQERRGLHSIEIPTPDGNWQELSTQKDIEEALFQELAVRFNQAASTPFAVEPLLSSVGRFGELQGARDILVGKTLQDVDYWAAQLLPFLEQVLPTQPVVPPSDAEYVTSWKRVNERTSAGPSGITIPHLKAHTTSPFLTKIDNIVANLPYIWGFSPSRWKKGLDVMLEKKPGVRQINTLRAILLYEADFNHNNKRLGREMLRRAESANVVAIEQYGSRKNLSAVDQSLNKVLTFDLWRQFRTNGALCSNDAKSCYDRIVHNCASLCMQRVGTPVQPIISMFSTIQELSHHVRTIYGDSQSSYRHKTSPPIQGVGQGNGAGPQIWALVSTTVLNMLRDKGYGARFRAAMSNKQLSLVGYAFVDDTDLVLADNTSAKDTIKEMQNSLTAWEGGIRTTGGAIVPEKSHWYLIEFGWKDGQPFYQPVAHTPGQLQVRNSDGILQSLRRLEPWEAERTLGVRLAPDGNMDAQMKYMENKASEWAERIRTGHLPRHLTWLAWKTTISKTLEYPLPVTTLSQAQCKKLTSIVAKAALPKCGIMRSFPRALLHGPKKYGGLEVPDFFVEQGISHINRLIRYSVTDRHSTGLLIRHSCEAFKLQMGCSGHIFSLPTSLACLATPSWVFSTWQFAKQFNIQIEDDLPEFEPLREADRLIIPTFAGMGFTSDKLALLNQCRLYLKVTWLSEICTADGTKIESRVMQKPYAISIRPRYNYPNQNYPSASAWSAWSSALQHLCRSGNYLASPLGPWVCRKSISWWYDSSTSRLYYEANDGITEFQRASTQKTRSSSTKFRPIGNVSSVPPHAVPATAFASGMETVLTGIGKLIALNEGTETPQMKWIWDNITIPPNLEQLFPNNGDVIAVSDGSFKESHGTAAWIIRISPECTITGKVITPGPSNVQSAYRSELAGIYGILCTITMLEQKYKYRANITIGCDGLSALQRVSVPNDCIDPSLLHYDLIMACRFLRCQSSWDVQWHHVRGHQDEVRSIDSLDIWEQLNIEMDAAAKAYHKETLGTHITPILHGEPWRVVIQGRKISSKLMEELRLVCTSGAAEQYWAGKQRFGQGSIHEVDWDSFGAALKLMPLKRQHWISKTTSGFCAVGTMMFKRKEHPTSECPRCNEVETVEHVWKCTYDTGALWDNSLSNLREWMLQHDTHPDMAQAIIQGLRHWRSGGSESNFPSSSDWIRELVDQQTKLGWRNFFEGMIATNWQVAQQSYLNRIGSRKSSRRWATAIIRKLWQIAWDMWEHRNGYLHARNTGLHSQYINKVITSEFQLGWAMLDRETRALFHPGLASTISKPIEVREQWIKRVQAARQKMETTIQPAFQSERSLMSAWLSGN